MLCAFPVNDFEIVDGAHKTLAMANFVCERTHVRMPVRARKEHFIGIIRTHEFRVGFSRSLCFLCHSSGNNGEPNGYCSGASDTHRVAVCVSYSCIQHIRYGTIIMLCAHICMYVMELCWQEMSLRAYVGASLEVRQHHFASAHHQIIGREDIIINFACSSRRARFRRNGGI